MTVRDLIKSSLRLIGAIASGETPSADEVSDSLEVLNLLLDSWSSNNLLIYEIKRETFALVPGTQAYNFGTGEAFNSERPTQILNATLSSNAIEYPVEIIDYSKWANIPMKGSSSSLPTKLYYESSFPSGKVNLYPVPNSAANLNLMSLKPFSSLDADAELSFPPGYKKALRYNLAVELAPEFGKQIDVDIKDEAKKLRADLKRANYKPTTVKADAFGLNGERTKFDIMKGD